MASFLKGFGSSKETYTLVATVDEYSLVFVLLHNSQQGVTIERHGVHHSGSLPGTFVLDELLSQLRSTFPVRELLVSFTAPYFEIQSAQQIIARVHATGEITKGEAHSIAHTMIEQAERRLRRRIFEESGILPNDFIAQKAHVLHWKIDGYAVDHIEGYKGHEVEGYVLGTFLRQDYVDFTAKLKKKHSIAAVSVVHPFEGVQKTKKQGVFVYISEEKTKILSQNSTASAFTESFSPGGNRFRNVFREEFGMIENIAQEFEDKYIQGNLSEEVRAKVHGFLLPEVYNFGTLVREKLGTLHVLPAPSVFLFGHGVRFKEIVQLFSGDVSYKPFQQKPTTQVLLAPFPQSASVYFDARYTPAFFLTQAAYAKEIH